MAHAYEIWDVFTAEPFAGNPLAVVFDSDDLSAEAMQKIAREFNLSETIFFGAPDGEAHPARIFTPVHEMPFAGHPTVGGSIAAARRAGGLASVTLSLPAGPTRCVVGDGTATIEAPVRPTLEPGAPDDATLAQALGLPSEAIGFGAFRPTRASSGPQWTIVPLASPDHLAALDPARFDFGPLGEPYASAYLIAEGGAADYQCRMFAPLGGIAEDPATGSAAVAFAALVVAAATPGDGTHRIAIAQGIEMGRPSRLTIDVDVTDGEIARVQLTGAAVRVAEGTLLA